MVDGEAALFGADDAARRLAADHIAKSKGAEGLMEIFCAICKRIYQLENP